MIIKNEITESLTQFGFKKIKGEDWLDFQDQSKDYFLCLRIGQTKKINESYINSVVEISESVLSESHRISVNLANYPSISNSAYVSDKMSIDRWAKSVSQFTSILPSDWLQLQDCLAEGKIGKFDLSYIR